MLGRIDDAIKVRGTLVYPSVVEDVLTHLLNTGAEWRITVDWQTDSSDVMTIQYEHCDDALGAGLERQLQERLGLRPVLEHIEPDTLERFHAKAKRVADHRDE